MSDEKRYVRRIVKKEAEYQARQKFNAKLGPTQCYIEEKDIFLKVVEKGDYESMSDFLRHAARNEAERAGFVLPPESEFLKTGAEAETA